MFDTTTTIAAAKETVFTELGSEVAILSLKNGKYYGLNPVGAFVWTYLQVPHNMADLCDAVTREFEVTSQQCEHDLNVLLREMLEQGLIEIRS